jgi:hypothetical protein
MAIGELTGPIWDSTPRMNRDVDRRTNRARPTTGSDPLHRNGRMDCRSLPTRTLSSAPLQPAMYCASITRTSASAIAAASWVCADLVAARPAAAEPTRRAAPSEVRASAMTRALPGRVVGGAAVCPRRSGSCSMTDCRRRVCPPRSGSRAMSDGHVDGIRPDAISSKVMLGNDDMGGEADARDLADVDRRAVG